MESFKSIGQFEKQTLIIMVGWTDGLALIIEKLFVLKISMYMLGTSHNKYFYQLPSYYM